MKRGELRIKITDLPRDMIVNQDELKRIKGGARCIYLYMDTTTGNEYEYCCTPDYRGECWIQYYKD